MSDLFADLLGQERAVALCKEAGMFPPQMISCWRRLARVMNNSRPPIAATKSCAV